jgi:hypothetical protein
MTLAPLFYLTSMPSYDYLLLLKEGLEMTHGLQESFHDSNGEGEEVTAFTLTDLQENQKYQVALYFIFFFKILYTAERLLIYPSPSGKSLTKLSLE